MKPLGTFRLALAIAVLFGHSWSIMARSLPAFFVPIASIAPQLGVLMFFTVSGFIICYTVEKHYGARPLAFLANRALRIYPVHVATFLMAWFILWNIKSTPYTGDIPMISRQGMIGVDLLLALSIFPGTKFAPNPAMWSVFVEAQFYLFIGLATFLPQRKALYWLAGAFVCSCVLLDLNPVPWLVDMHYGALGPFFVFFTLGGAAHYLRSRWAWPVFALSLAACLKYILVLTQRPDIPPVAMAATFLGALAIFGVLVTRGRANAVDRHLGGLSYPLYACHVPIISFMAMGRQGVADWFLVAGTCLAVAVLLYLTIEKPLMGKRSKIRATPRSVVPAAPVYPTGRGNSENIASP